MGTLPLDGFSIAELRKAFQELASDHSKSPPKRKAPEAFIPTFPKVLLVQLRRLGMAGWFYLVLLRESRVRKENPLLVTTRCLTTYGFSRKDKTRALTVLETAGLIRVERRPRKNPLVTLLEEKLRP
jgi:hypothetical protein